MKLVVDANVLLSAIIRDSSTRNAILDSRLELSAPDFLLKEVGKHVEHDKEIRRKTGLDEFELKQIFDLLSKAIRIVPLQEYKEKLEEGLKLASHNEDAPYFAVALKEEDSIWSNDLGMTKQTKIKINDTKSVLKLLEPTTSF